MEKRSAKDNQNEPEGVFVKIVGMSYENRISTNYINY